MTDPCPSVAEKLDGTDLDDIWFLIKRLSNRTPGPDGIPYKAYQALGKGVASVFLDLTRWLTTVEVAPPLLKEGHLYLIPKGGVPLPGNFR